jgi:hypothetical protein
VYCTSAKKRGSTQRDAHLGPRPAEDGELPEGRREIAELLRPVTAVASEDANLITGDGCHRALPVVLHLVEPVVAGRKLVALGSELRRAEGAEIEGGRFRIPPG